ncbi:gamma-glutamyltransferase [Paralimibaculum aggregatum]|uniref:Gamma-glutamyltransferase n=1 Tax=Paralimibaculum aggregatum TaxID=3036245 RepID=A0ABQ6LS52_9RHOB|nr:gamma-glutamyltransferase [Limibaculum sp. NKW23]GMG84809.1 gamma-glutamyltransferase [Limibaculum sp. NKW23]
MGKGFGIAAGHRLTVEAGAEVLAAGGSAMDAALAGAFMAMVAEPVLAGLLGGGFAMVRAPGGSCELLDAFVDTPRRKRPEGEIDLREIHADFGGVTQAFHIGAGAVAASALAPGLAEAHARFGRMPLRDVVAPAAAAARAGVALTPYQARLAEIVRPILCASAGARALHCRGDGTLKAAGERLANPDFADVLEEFAAEGPRFVTEGEIAARLVEHAAAGGHLTRADCEDCRPAWRRPAEERRGAARLALNPPPSLGGTLIGLALALAPRGADAVALARVFAAVARARAEHGLDTAPEAGAARLADPVVRARLAKALAALKGRPAAQRGTTQISVIDGAGLGVSLTLSNGEGCGDILPGTGIMPNNMLGEADLVPGLAEGAPLRWPEGCRLASMMAPLAASWPDGRVAMLGSGGSNRIRTALAQVLLRLVDAELPLADAIAAPRLHVEDAGAEAVDIEGEDLPEGSRAALAAAFPEARFWDSRSMFFGGVHGVEAGPRGFAAAGDPRRDGHALTG